MNITLRTLMAMAGLVAATSAAAQVTLYQGPNFRGQSFTADRQVGNLERYGFNDRASSLVVSKGRWEVCEHADFQGRCVTLRPGEYADLRGAGLENQISSVRFVGDDRVAQNNNYNTPNSQNNYDRHYNDNRRGYATRDEEFRRHRGERIFEVPVTSVRAVVTQSNQRCWMERQEVQSGGNSNANVAGAVVGGILGGIIGHQFGGGRGNDVATAGGAVGGALLGSNIARNNSGGTTSTQDVQRCEEARGNAQPDYWDVGYVFRGVEHHVQMTQPPGSTITVNGEGEPRI